MAWTAKGCYVVGEVITSVLLNQEIRALGSTTAHGLVLPDLGRAVAAVPDPALADEARQPAPAAPRRGIALSGVRC